MIMDEVYRLENPILNYAWGSHRSIAQLLNRSIPSSEPEAEMWMGAHPKAPSMVRLKEKTIPLDELIRREPEKMLGKKVMRRFDGTLPFLFKVLAAEKPLSIQAHPNKVQAQEGFRRENEKKIPLNSPIRNYKDDRHKPELMMALTPFTMVYGFQSPRDIRERIERYGFEFPSEVTDTLLLHRSEEVLKHFFLSLMTLSDSKKKPLIEKGVARARALYDEDPMFQWIVKLHDHYPQDMGIFTPLFLNLITLSPGEAVFVPAGELHSYLDGTGLELMANSDNVLRGGLTGKHMDFKELTELLNFSPLAVKVLQPESYSDGEKGYPSPVPEFQLSVFSCQPKISYRKVHRDVPEILFCTRGEVTLQLDNTASVRIHGGETFFIPAITSCYTLRGDASFFRASVNKSML